MQKVINNKFNIIHWKQKNAVKKNLLKNTILIKSLLRKKNRKNLNQVLYNLKLLMGLKNIYKRDKKSLNKNIIVRQNKKPQAPFNQLKKTKKLKNLKIILQLLFIQNKSINLKKFISIKKLKIKKINLLITKTVKFFVMRVKIAKYESFTIINIFSTF